MAEYLAFHYLAPRDLLPPGVKVPSGVANFPLACARLLAKAKVRPARALDLGCAVGRATFELARHCPEVVGLDYSRSFIRAATRLRQVGHLRFALRQEGLRTTPAQAQVDPRLDRTRVRFHVGDALHLPHKLGLFDLVLAANLIDRLPHPAKFLTQVAPKLVIPGGVLLLTSPYTWSSAYTAESRWFKNSFATLQKFLRPHFRLLHRQNLPFLLREHCRKFQYTFADATLWQKI